MQDEYDINREVIDDLSRNLEELENPLEGRVRELEKKEKEQVQLQDYALQSEQKIKSKEENKIIVGDIQSEMEYLQKRLATEPLENPEAETKQGYSDKRLIDAMAEDEEEKENYQHGKKLVEKEIVPLERKYHQFGRIDPIDKIRFEELLKEEKSEGRTYKELEERYRKL